VYICTYILVIKKSEITLFAGKWIELEIIMLSKARQAPEAKYKADRGLCGRAPA
jgi:hypothetical protein